MTYEISGTSTPSKVPYKWGLLKFGMKVTARLQPKVTAKPCSFLPIDGWSILDSIGGRVTHRSVKTDDGVVIVEVTEQ